MQMSGKALHIVSFDNPYPPNYGGVIDVYYKIMALHQIGYSIHLHCFVKEIPEHFDELKALTATVCFYKIEQNPLYFLSRLPFSVISRSDRKLIENIVKEEAPILFDGLKTTCLMNALRLKSYKKYLRLHNIEPNYYKGIASSETNFMKKIAFYLEARKYKRYEYEMNAFNKVFTLSEFENEVVNQRFSNAVYIPVFHGNVAVKELSDFGNYALYHGDLTTSDNRKTVMFLVGVFKQIPDYQLIIASGSNEEFVKSQIDDASNIQFVALKGFDHLKQLFSEAHLNICWSFQKSGTKLKLINSLFNSRHCIINENIIDDYKVSGLCIQVKNEEELLTAIKKTIQLPFTETARRKKILESHLNDIENARLLAAELSK